MEERKNNFELMVEKRMKEVLLKGNRKGSDESKHSSCLEPLKEYVREGGLIKTYN